ncbi:tRNA (5-methylaminomethyl-2-thiouridylate)-methyltransferase [Candidatus Nitrosarchaeum limnium SFB1]|jgi:tRNA U34 2-thiouridine synthase MnmA/TrmU|uniref:tRNA (5-methylaminomethyl-2-thiouridylate)-methyltransferase n=1 Tax=Candidatus Nitrosarchaeum limnium SFB1 TaxID=886738 RepID=F3KLR6_9ARCH|nr:tRNA (5-methylaminomethyl-2-thiouridylate)-methyltransferase [Candidatus Nitrosarchaeum limnium SFB1]
MYDAKFVYWVLIFMIVTEEKKKVVALLSGGLDSQLAVRMMQEQGFEVSAVAIKTPFCDFDCGRGCGFEIREKADDLNVNLKTVYLGDEYIEMLKHPKHGIGAGFNPCVDCRTMMFNAAKKHMEEIGAEFIISGEVLGQRPMSQHAPSLRTIEKDSGLVGKIVRPLSAALLPETDPEKNGLIKRENLGMIRGRTRRAQLEMAKKYGIENPPNAGGGCLLTDPTFGLRAKDLFSHTETPTINDIDLLKIGRHFRLDEQTKFVVGRNKDENEMIKAIALPSDVLFQARDHMGPVSILRGKDTEEYEKLVSAVTLRYSDAPKGEQASVIINKNNVKEEIITQSVEEESYIKFRI